MVCLPEKYIYGWLFSVKTDSDKLLNYKLKCCDILFEHFHGALTIRTNVLEERLANEEKMDVNLVNRQMSIFDKMN